MDIIRTFFELNRPVIHFGYGLTFFVMGLAIAIQSRSSSRLALARSLAWLAAFGINNSLYEWGELFSPVHEAYLTERGIWILHDFHLLFLSISFVCLFEFGVTLLKPLNRGQWLHSVTLGLFLSYVLIIVAILPRAVPDPHTWHNIANALACYMIGFPGALMAAYGLREQAFDSIAPLRVPHIVSTLRLTGISLLLYAVFGGLLPPPVPFFPGNIINSETFEAAFGLPPLVFQTLIGLTLAVTVIRALEIFNVEMQRRIEVMEQKQILASERERIARELHDGSIQTVYTASLLVDSARKLSTPESQVASRLDKAVDVLNDAMIDLRRNLGDLHGKSEVEDLEAELRTIAGDPRYRSLIQVSLDLDLAEAEPISPLRAEHVLSIVKEGLSNIVRHAQARQAWIMARAVDGRFQLSIRDDGEGFSDEKGTGYGLRNMQDRARLLGGRLEVKSERGKGTAIFLDIPHKDDYLPGTGS